MTARSTVEPEFSISQRGRVGILGLIASESTFFGCFLVVYLFYLGRSLNGPYPAEVLELPIAATVCLLSSSVTIWLATRALRRDRTRSFGLWFLATIVLGALFLVATAQEWAGLIYEHGLTIRTNLFGTTFYSLVGFHAAHVTIGILIMALVLVLSVLGHVRVRDAERVEMLSWYWHFVDAVWIAVFTVVYVVGR